MLDIMMSSPKSSQEALMNYFATPTPSPKKPEKPGATLGAGKATTHGALPSASKRLSGGVATLRHLGAQLEDSPSRERSLRRQRKGMGSSGSGIAGTSTSSFAMAQLISVRFRCEKLKGGPFRSFQPAIFGFVLKANMA